ncbi:MAG: restriction endonuclease subunit S [Intestinibacter sp.]|nr:restriction endonuclease subunit S [Intestinibacter sp.]
MIKGGTFDANGKIGYTDSFCDKKYISIIKDGAGVGRTRILPKNSFCISTMGIIISNQYSVIEYLYYMMSQLDFTKYVVGATIPHIYFEDYGNQKIKLPCLDEQQKIADFLSSFDKKIDAEKETLEHLKEMKKGLLQQIFV